MKKSTVLLLLLALVACNIESYGFADFSKSKTEKFQFKNADNHIIFYVVAPFEFNPAVNYPQARYATEKAVKTELKELSDKLDAPAKFNYYLKAFAKAEHEEIAPPYNCHF